MKVVRTFDKAKRAYRHVPLSKSTVELVKLKGGKPRGMGVHGLMRISRRKLLAVLFQNWPIGFQFN